MFIWNSSWSKLFISRSVRPKLFISKILPPPLPWESNGGPLNAVFNNYIALKHAICFWYCIMCSKSNLYKSWYCGQWWMVFGYNYDMEWRSMTPICLPDLMLFYRLPPPLELDYTISGKISHCNRPTFHFRFCKIKICGSMVNFISYL